MKTVYLPKSFLRSISLIILVIATSGCDTIRYAGKVDATLIPETATAFKKDYFQAKGYKQKKGGIFPPKSVAFYKAELPSGKNITIEFHHKIEKGENAYTVFICCGHLNEEQKNEIDDKVKEIARELESKTAKDVSTETFLVMGRF